MIDLVFERMKPEDLKEVASIEKVCYGPDERGETEAPHVSCFPSEERPYQAKRRYSPARPAGGLAWTVGMFEREISFPISHFFVLRERSQPEILGYGGFWRILEEAHLVNLTIRQESQRQGFGRRFLSFLLAEARRLGLTRATLEVRPSNSAAVRLYESEGFIGAAFRRGYYSDNGEDALVMWKEGL